MSLESAIIKFIHEAQHAGYFPPGAIIDVTVPRPDAERMWREMSEHTREVPADRFGRAMYIMRVEEGGVSFIVRPSEFPPPTPTKE